MGRGQACVFCLSDVTENNSRLYVTGADADAFFKIIASSQGRRLDDQRVSLPTLPGISGKSDRRENGRHSSAGIPVSHTAFKLLVLQTNKEYRQMLLDLLPCYFYVTLPQGEWYAAHDACVSVCRRIHVPTLLSLKNYSWQKCL